MGVGLRPGWKRPEPPPNPEAARAARGRVPVPRGKARPRANRRRVEAAGESEGRIGAKTLGNGRWHPDPAEQRRPELRQSFRRATWP
jgi:hypothetical protein